MREFIEELHELFVKHNIAEISLGSAWASDWQGIYDPHMAIAVRGGPDVRIQDGNGLTADGLLAYLEGDA